MSKSRCPPRAGVATSFSRTANAPPLNRPSRPQERAAPSDNRSVNGSVFRFRLERVRALRERKEQQAQQELARRLLALRRRDRAAQSEAELERAHSEHRARASEPQALAAGELVGPPGIPGAHRGATRRTVTRAGATQGYGRRARRHAYRRRDRTRDAQAPQRAPARRAPARRRRPRTERAGRDRRRPLRSEWSMSTGAIAPNAGVPEGELAISPTRATTAETDRTDSSSRLGGRPDKRNLSCFLCCFWATPIRDSPTGARGGLRRRAAGRDDGGLRLPNRRTERKRGRCER